MEHTITRLAGATKGHMDYDLWQINNADGTVEFRVHYHNWDTCDPDDSGNIMDYAKTKEEAIEKFMKRYEYASIIRRDFSSILYEIRIFLRKILK